MPEGQIILFALVFLRVMAFVVAWPIFGSATVPVSVKILLALVLTTIFAPLANLQNASAMNLQSEVMSLAFREVMIGLFLGFLMRMFFFAVSIAGEITSMAIGLASAQVYNPAQGSSSNVVEQFQSMLATLFFLGINGHHFFIEGFVKSYELIPVANSFLNSAGFSTLVMAGQQVLVIGLKLSAPVLVAIFMANVAMGILGRAVPQINVLMTSLAVQISLGMVVLLFSLPLFVHEMNALLEVMINNFFDALKVI